MIIANILHFCESISGERFHCDGIPWERNLSFGTQEEFQSDGIYSKQIRVMQIAATQAPCQHLESSRQVVKWHNFPAFVTENLAATYCVFSETAPGKRGPLGTANTPKLIGGGQASGVRRVNRPVQAGHRTLNPHLHHLVIRDGLRRGRMRILVVDDELVSRMKLQKILSSLGECEAVGGGKVAIAVFEKALKENAPFDLVTLDIVMPEVDGTEALVELRELETEYGLPEKERAVIMMVTSHRDKDNIVTAISAGCDNYIVKPFDKKTIFEKLKSSRLKHHLLGAEGTAGHGLSPQTVPGRASSGPMEDPLSGLKAVEVVLPPLPDTGSKLDAMFKKVIDVKSVADLLRGDIAISLRLMKLANSSYYGNLAKTTTLAQAIGRLGLVATKQYVDGICNQVSYVEKTTKYKSFYDSVYRHSRWCAMISEAVSDILGLKSRIDFYTAGLLHDVGKLISVQGIADFERKGNTKEQVNMAQLTAMIEAQHSDVGADILRKWNFANEYIEIARYHDNMEPKSNPSNELLVVHFANLLAKGMLDGQGSHLEAEAREGVSARLLGVTPDIVHQVVDRVDGQMGMLDAFFR
jgi:putative nucleotidyltransferase with HDIG domain